MNRKMSLMDRIDYVRANSVTDEDYKKFWGVSIDEHVSELMKHWDALLEQTRP